MSLLAGFIEVFFRGFAFIGLALAIGGIVFYYAVLPRAGGGPDNLPRLSASLISAGAFSAAATQLLALAGAQLSLADEGGRLQVSAFLSTGFARAGIVNTGFALALGLSSLRLRKRPESARLQAWTAFIALLFLGSGAWLTHGASRLENAAPLMAATVIHQLAAAAWIGGTMHLAGAWRLLRKSPEAGALWPLLVSRFSPLAMSSVALLLAAGVYLSWFYIGGFEALAGTAYGTMVVTKAALMGFALVLGGMNTFSISAWKTGRAENILVRTPAFVKAEAAIGAVVLMAAAALSSQPVAAEIPPAERASPGEVLRVFAPKAPQLAPAIPKVRGEAPSSLDPFARPEQWQKVQSNFNHNTSGLFVIALGLGALLYRATGIRTLRHWPLLFLPFSLFLLVVAEPTAWPLGKEGFFETLASPEVLQHRVATLLVAAFGVFEWRVHLGRAGESKERYLFPLLCFMGGALLLTHSHSVFASKWSFLIEVSHNAIGILAVAMGAARWLELRLSGRPEARAAGLVWPACFVLVGLVLLFYREA